MWPQHGLDLQDEKVVLQGCKLRERHIHILGVYTQGNGVISTRVHCPNL